MHFKTVLLFALLLGCFSCNLQKKEIQKLDSQPQNLVPYKINKELPHDSLSYTQGLVYADEKLYESTGGEHSWLAEVDVQTGEQKRKVTLDKKYFGEGITVLNNKIYQLTWKHKTGFIYNKETFELLGSFQYDFDGWGITTNGTHLLISDGSNRIYFVDTLHFKVSRQLEVTEKGLPVNKLNELEYIKGFIWANRWETNHLLKIDAQTGQVVGRLDLTAVAEKVRSHWPDARELNGIAYNPQKGELLITGKLWPRAFLISPE